ncbi:ABC transporter A family member 11 [Glycine soja]
MSALNTCGYVSTLFWVPLITETETETICGEPVDLEGQRWPASSRRRVLTSLGIFLPFVFRDGQVKSFKEKDEVDAWLFSNPMRCLEALHFSERNDIVISYDLQTNSTSLQQRGKYEDPTALFQLPLQLAAEREIARYLIGEFGIGVSEGIRAPFHESFLYCGFKFSDPLTQVHTFNP